MKYETIEHKVEDNGTAWVVLNRPYCLNSINMRMFEELQHVFDAIASRGDIRVVILTGGEGAFCAGADVRDVGTPADSHLATLVANTSMPMLPAVMSRLNFSPMVEGIANLAQPVIAAISGPAVGGGCELALACDLRIASTTATFGLGEINIGVIPMAGGTQRLPRQIGVAKAKEMLFFGKLMDAEEAYRVGLANKVVPIKSLMEEANNWAKRLALMPPLALKAVKSSVNYGMEMSLPAGLVYELREGMLLMGTDDRVEGMKAFAEKRKPVFKGQ